MERWEPRDFFPVALVVGRINIQGAAEAFDLGGEFKRLDIRGFRGAGFGQRGVGF